MRGVIKDLNEKKTFDILDNHSDEIGQMENRFCRKMTTKTNKSRYKNSKKFQFFAESS